MDDSSEWDFAGAFTAVQAALLMEGKNPSNCGPDGRDGYQNQVVSEVILTRMQSDYNGTCTCHALDLHHQYQPSSLPSSWLSLLVSDLDKHDGDHRLNKWLFDSEKSDFHKQSFSRKDIQRWLDANHFPSKYQFFKTQPVDTETPSGRWPWGNHHTEMLGHVEALCRFVWNLTTGPKCSGVPLDEQTVAGMRYRNAHRNDRNRQCLTRLVASTC